jgi:hypothetical protein
MIEKPHYTEADLLETWYTQPGEAMPVMMHLASCPPCAARYETLDRKLRGEAACGRPCEPQETFWTRQRLGIMRRIDRQHALHARLARTTRIAAGTVLAFFLGGAIVYKTLEPALTAPPVVITRTTATAPAQVAQTSTDELQISRDPWQSEQLEEFHSVVEWESWIDNSERGKL